MFNHAKFSKILYCFICYLYSAFSVKTQAAETFKQKSKAHSNQNLSLSKIF